MTMAFRSSSSFAIADVARGAGVFGKRFFCNLFLAWVFVRLIVYSLMTELPCRGLLIWDNARQRARSGRCKLDRRLSTSPRFDTAREATLGGAIAVPKRVEPGRWGKSTLCKMLGWLPFLFPRRAVCPAESLGAVMRNERS